MACFDENTLVAFFSGGRSSALVIAVEAHAAECRTCRDLLAAYARMSAENGTGRTQRPATGDHPWAACAASVTPVTGAPTEKEEVPFRMALVNASKLIGTVLKGKWQIESLVGFGGMAFVFAARHRNGRRVAIKCIRPELALEPSLVERFLREGYVANKIEHPGAVAILDDDVMDDGTPFLVMELLTGESLRQLLERGTLDLDEALRVTADVLDVLAIAHEKGIVHRDLKPDNLFQTTDGSIKVLDFGIARLREQSRSTHETQSGTTMGTVGFMPPEQARGLTDQIDARSDVWAIGATLYSLLSGRSVHEARTPNEALLLAMTKPVPAMATLLPWLEPSVAALLDRALAFEREDRFPSARAMRDALETARSELAGTVPSAPSFVAPAPAPRAQTEITGSRASETIIARALARRGAAVTTAPPMTRVRPLAIVGVCGGLLATVLVLAGLASWGGSRQPTADRAATAAVLPAETPAPPASPAAVTPPPPEPGVRAAIATATSSASTAPPVPSARPRKPAPAPTTSAVATPSPAAPTRDPLGLRH